MKEKFGNLVKNDILRQCIQGCRRRRERNQPVHYSRVPGICLYYIVIIKQKFREIKIKKTKLSFRLFKILLRLRID